MKKLLIGIIIVYSQVSSAMNHLTLSVSNKRAEELLLYAIKKFDDGVPFFSYDEIASLLAGGVSPNVTNNIGQTALNVAACSRYSHELIPLLISYQADVHAKKYMGRTALHDAARTCTEPDVIAQLLDRGVEIDGHDENGHTALHEACIAHNVDVVKFLVKRGANQLLCEDGGRMPMHIAASVPVRRIELLACLITEENVNTGDACGWTPLHWAAYSGHESWSRYREHTEQISYLLRQGAQVNAETTHELDLEALNNIAQQRGVEYATDIAEKGVTPLHLAAAKGHFKAVKLLLTHGADVNARTARTQSTPLHWAVAKAPNKFDWDVQTVWELLEHGADPSAKDINGASPLHLINPFSSRIGVLALLTMNGADLNAQDRKGKTLVSKCSAFQTGEIMLDFLIKSGATISAGDIKGLPAVHDLFGMIGSRRRLKNMLAILLDNDVTLEGQDDMGRTFVHRAAKQPDNVELCETALKAITYHTLLKGAHESYRRVLCILCCLQGSAQRVYRLPVNVIQHIFRSSDDLCLDVIRMRARKLGFIDFFEVGLSSIQPILHSENLSAERFVCLVAFDSQNAVQNIINKKNAEGKLAFEEAEEMVNSEVGQHYGGTRRSWERVSEMLQPTNIANNWRKLVYKWLVSDVTEKPASCAVCLQFLLEEECQQFSDNCQHKLHPECIVKLKKSDEAGKVCPLCRRAIEGHY